MIGVHVALLVQGMAIGAYGTQSLIYNVLRMRGASVASEVPRFAAMAACSAGALYAELKLKSKSTLPVLNSRKSFSSIFVYSCGANSTRYGTPSFGSSSY